MSGRTIFMPTVQSTGTWFLVEFLRAHNDVVYFTMWWDDEPGGEDEG